MGMAGEPDRWTDEMAALGAICRAAGLTGEVKWAKPCFTWQGGNVAILQPFRDELRLMFFKGVLVADPHGLLGEQGENTQGARVLRVRSADEIARNAAAIRALIDSAIAVEAAGLKPAYPAKDAPGMPQEMIDALDADPGLAAAFHGLTPGRQRSWALHVAEARKPETRAARIARAAPQIRAGKGWNER